MAVVGAAMLSAAATWVVNRTLAAPDETTAVASRVTVLETKQVSTDTTLINQGNDISYLVQAVQKIGNKVGADVGPAPIHK